MKKKISIIEKAYHILNGAKHNERASNIMKFSAQFVWPVDGEPEYMQLTRRKALRSALEEAVENIWHSDFKDYDPTTKTSKRYLEVLNYIYPDWIKQG